MEKWLSVVTQLKEGCFVCFVIENVQHLPLNWGEPTKTNKLLFAGNGAKHTQKLRKFLFLHRNFLHKNFSKVY